MVTARDTILNQVLFGLRQGPDGLFFAVPLDFLETRLADLPSDEERQATVATLASLGFTLHQQKNEAASRALMTVVDRVTRSLQEKTS